MRTFAGSNSCFATNAFASFVAFDDAARCTSLPEATATAPFSDAVVSATTTFTASDPATVTSSALPTPEVAVAPYVDAAGAIASIVIVRALSGALTDTFPAT